jgi:hypothetical protein
MPCSGSTSASHLGMAQLIGASTLRMARLSGWEEPIRQNSRIPV